MRHMLLACLISYLCLSNGWAESPTAPTNPPAAMPTLPPISPNAPPSATDTAPTVPMPATDAPTSPPAATTATAPPPAPEANATTPVANAMPTKNLTFGYLELTDDPRYTEKLITAQFLGQALGRPYSAAEVALKEVKFHGLEAGVSFALEPVKGAGSADLIKQVGMLVDKGVQFILADLPAATLLEVAQAFKGRNVAFFNVSAPEDSLRQAQCQANIFHTLPNHAMQADALVQYLVAHKWRNVLVLEGPAANDKLMTAAFERAAKRYGAKIVDKREFVLGSDPRERDKNNVALLTGGDYDIVYIADTSGEFARGANYHTLLPRPIIGSEGMNALAWNWAWERHGAPQVEKRFEKKADRRMSDVDWAAWMSVKAIATAVQQTKTTDFAKLQAFLLADSSALDGSKGNASSYRPWDHQLRQPMLLATHNWVVDRAPIQGFLHQTNNLDTLGFDQRDSQCKF